MLEEHFPSKIKKQPNKHLFAKLVIRINYGQTPSADEDHVKILSAVMKKT